MTVVAKSMQEVAMRYDTYANLIAQSPKAAEAGGEGTDPTDNGFFNEPMRQTPADLFEVSVDFDLHSVMAQTYHSMRPVKPKTTLRKYK